MLILLLTAWTFIPDVPEKTDQPNQALLNNIKEQLDIVLPEQCHAAEDSIFNYTQTLVYSIDDEHTLYQVPCNSGAYNRKYAIFIGTKDRLQLHAFAKPSTKKVDVMDAEIPDYVERNGMRTEYLLTNARFDINKQMLTEVSLGRGRGDMFRANRWIWGADSFLLLESWEDAEDDLK